MLSGLPRKTSWSLAGQAGETTPDGMPRLITTGRWDADLVRDDLRGYVSAGRGGADGVLAGDDTGFEKQSSCSTGAQRQYTGTAGRSPTASSNGTVRYQNCPNACCRHARIGRSGRVMRR
jgi:SRSO17 transposase